MPTSGPEMGALLQLAGVTAGYGGGDILHELDLSIGEGGITCIVGPNGAGKSTAMKAIVGLISLKSGHVAFAGEDITGAAPEHLTARGIAYVPQERNVFRTLTVQENLAMGAYLRRDDIGPVTAQIYELFPALSWGMSLSFCGAREVRGEGKLSPCRLGS